MKRPSTASLTLALVGAFLAAVSIAAGAGAGTFRSARRRTPVVEAVQKAAPAVVNITTNIPPEGWGPASRGSGSGVIVHPGGWVVTNSHVVRGASRVVVELAKAAGGTNRLHDARLVEDDPAHDLALLRIGGRAAFPYVALCPTSEVMVGETAIAIGNPFGLGDTVTVGIVSATGRVAAVSSGSTIHELLQTDASINLGNSGGALLNLDGELIGINSSKHPSGQGIAFTVPADAVQALLDRNLGAASRPPAPDDVAASVDPSHDALPAPAPSAPPAAPPSAASPSPLPPPRAAIAAPAPLRPPVGLTVRPSVSGLLVVAVAPESSAEVAGLRAGDVIVDVDGAPVGAASDFTRTVSAAPSGKSFSLSVQRGVRKLPVILLVP